LVEPLSVAGDRCSSFSGDGAFAFGVQQPTTSAPGCAAAPTHGVGLPRAPEGSTLGSAYDTLLYVRAGDCTGAELACGDDSVTVQQSLVALPLAAGQRIAIVVDGSGTASGPFTLHVANVDSDGDGFADADEVRRQTDPVDAESLPNVNARSAAVAYLTPVEKVWRPSRRRCAPPRGERKSNEIRPAVPVVAVMRRPRPSMAATAVLVAERF
jgi:hypothetical protein